MKNTDAFIGEWLSHRKVLLQMLEEVKTEQLGYKPWEQAMSLSQQALHIVGAMDMFAATVKNGTFTPGQPPKEFSTAEELRAIIAESTKATEAVLRSIAVEQLEKAVDFHGRSMPGSVLLQNAKDHEIHHKGQLFVYLRLLGIEKLPFFVSRG
ncbi:DinB family protein [Cohnella sp. AR92]|uniref:DinB family protein n=1 Tax=Cohnella sp. AR92 TaxID=648716 RepID=UPI000F8E9933|nr:DinB family protein [Cohnella sp. AR92]RUS42826.1 damage-inducible protein DinB [Cohnella sp. AR92]